VSAPFISVNVGNLKSQIDRINNSLDRASEIALAAAQRALVESAEDQLAKAQGKIHSVSGDLAASGTVQEPILTSEEIVVRWGFNSKYSRMRDQGGDIVPVHAKALAIPLDPVKTAAGIARFSSPREDVGAAGNGLFLVKIWGKLFLAEHIGHGKTSRISFRWQLVPHVHQEGNHFVSGTVQEEAQNTVVRVNERVAEALATGGNR
jgi:hypothetical protein